MFNIVNNLLIWASVLIARGIHTKLLVHVETEVSIFFQVTRIRGGCNNASNHICLVNIDQGNSKKKYKKCLNLY